MFESRFESGNLEKAVKIGEFEYNLCLRKLVMGVFSARRPSIVSTPCFAADISFSRDLRTLRHTQWYFFSIRNVRKGQTYRLNIINLMKVGGCVHKKPRLSTHTHPPFLPDTRRPPYTTRGCGPSCTPLWRPR